MPTPAQLLEELKQKPAQTPQEEKLAKLYTEALKLYGETYGYSHHVVAARAPGRVNLMGRHIDYMGGPVNPVATQHNIVVVAGPRPDDTVNLVNTDPAYPPQTFKISQITPPRIHSLAQWDQWTLQQAQGRSQVQWSDYVKGLIAYLHGRLNARVTGFNAAVAGDIPPKRGLASSSALVIATALALNQLNRLGLTPQQLIDIGYSEWYVMTRGATADHAAILHARKGHVTHIECEPTRPRGHAPLPPGYTILIADPGHPRPHTPQATNFLRATAAEYRIAVLILKTAHPQHADRINLLRDLNPRNTPLPQIYRMLKALPVKATRRQLRRLVDDKYLDQLEEAFANHREPPQGYRPRLRALYGIAEAERARALPQHLRRGETEAVLRLIETSHDGDRVALYGPDGRQQPYNPEQQYTDQALEKLAQAAEQGLEQAQLKWIPGAYQRSIPPIDHLCDIIRHRLKGHAAAQILGAGLGGNIMIMIRRDKLPQLQQAYQEYRETYGVKPTHIEIHPSQGASLLTP